MLEGCQLVSLVLAAPVAVLVNAPVTAWFGLDYYVMIPSLLVGGLAIGTACGTGAAELASTGCAQA